jgi:hypothetical protein
MMGRFLARGIHQKKKKKKKNSINDDKHKTLRRASLGFLFSSMNHHKQM